MKTIKNIIFIGGIHGVGKTTICNKLSKELSIKHYSSSNLIARLDSQRIKKDKRANNILDNQDILLRAIELFLDEDKTYLLDGHFCLIDRKHSIQEVPTMVFEKMGIKGIVVISDYEIKILERLKSRDGKDYSMEFINRFQEKEIYHANYVAEQIKVPVKIINLSNKEKYIFSSVKELVNNSSYT